LAAVDAAGAGRDVDDTPTESLSAGRGVLLSTCHLGPCSLCMSAIAAFGRTPYYVTSWALQPLMPGYWGRRVARRRLEARARGERFVNTVGCFPVLKALLQQQEIVCLFFDMPGSRQTRFLGKQVMLATGSVRLAIEADALVLPLRTRRVGHRVWVDVGASLDPRDFASADELQEALAARHERWIMELPATMEDPNREGAWEREATAHAWRRPQ
jgi:lauroyl/myristoyl acyltransferase